MKIYCCNSGNEKCWLILHSSCKMSFSRLILAFLWSMGMFDERKVLFFCKPLTIKSHHEKHGAERGGHSGSHRCDSMWLAAWVSTAPSLPCRSRLPCVSQWQVERSADTRNKNRGTKWNSLRKAMGNKGRQMGVSDQRGFLWNSPDEVIIKWPLFSPTLSRAFCRGLVMVWLYLTEDVWKEK